MIALRSLIVPVAMPASRYYSVEAFHGSNLKTH